jgi:hypothetical protein
MLLRKLIKKRSLTSFEMTGHSPLLSFRGNARNLSPAFSFSMGESKLLMTHFEEQPRYSVAGRVSLRATGHRNVKLRRGAMDLARASFRPNVHVTTTFAGLLNAEPATVRGSLLGCPNTAFPQSALSLTRLFPFDNQKPSLGSIIGAKPRRPGARKGKQLY